jgi:hypothetical protein
VAWAREEAAPVATAVTWTFIKCFRSMWLRPFTLRQISGKRKQPWGSVPCQLTKHTHTRHLQGTGGSQTQEDTLQDSSWDSRLLFSFNGFYTNLKAKKQVPTVT